MDLHIWMNNLDISGFTMKLFKFSEMSVDDPVLIFRSGNMIKMSRSNHYSWPMWCLLNV